MERLSFTDSTGVLWSVREDGPDQLVGPRRADQLPGSVWLRFECDLEVRRLWHYPDDWRGLSPLQLESLLERASTVIARFRPASHRRDAPDSGAARAAPDSTAQLPPPPADTSGARRPGPGRHNEPEPG